MKGVIEGELKGVNAKYWRDVHLDSFMIYNNGKINT